MCDVWLHCCSKVKRAHSLHRMSDGAWRPDTLCSAVAAQSSAASRRAAVDTKNWNRRKIIIFFLYLQQTEATSNGSLLAGRTTFIACFDTWPRGCMMTPAFYVRGCRGSSAYTVQGWKLPPTLLIPDSVIDDFDVEPDISNDIMADLEVGKHDHSLIDLALFI